ncbi:putative metabolite transport protein [Salmonella sp. NCTC 11881]|nr:putative metabolite transport protein [Salmonella sp. NCTC 11881]
MFLLDIIAIGVISVATMFVSTPLELLVMRVLIGIVIGADYPIATSMITEFSNTRQRAFSIGFYRRDVVRRRDLRQPGGLLAV